MGRHADFLAQLWELLQILEHEADAQITYSLVHCILLTDLKYESAGKIPDGAYWGPFYCTKRNQSVMRLSKSQSASQYNCIHNYLGSKTSRSSVIKVSLCMQATYLG